MTDKDTISEEEYEAAKGIIYDYEEENPTPKHPFWAVHGETVATHVTVFCVGILAGIYSIPKEALDIPTRSVRHAQDVVAYYPLTGGTLVLVVALMLVAGYGWLMHQPDYTPRGESDD